MGLRNSYLWILAMACCTLLFSTPLYAEDQPDPATPGVMDSNNNPEHKLAEEFGEFLGGEAQSHEVIQSLREGSYGQTATDTSTTGWGNVRITLKLAEARLAAEGITQPTTEQLDAVLLGNDTDPNGILALRESGMGWGEISQQYGYKLGTLMGNGKAPGLTSTTTSGVTNATNETGALNPGQAKKGGYISSGNQGSKGLTTAAGGTAASLSSQKPGNAFGHDKINSAGGASSGKGLVTVTGGGSGHTQSAIGKSSNGKALGHGKK